MGWVADSKNADIRLHTWFIVAVCVLLVLEEKEHSPLHFVT